METSSFWREILWTLFKVKKQMKQPFNWRGKTFFHSKSPTISCWKAQFWRDEFEGFDYPHKRCHMKIRNFFCLCCFFELMILNAKSLFSLKAKFGKDKNQTKRIERFLESIHKDLMFFPKKVKEVSDWKYLRDSKNDSFIFFESIEPIQDIDSFFSKDFLHWSNKKKHFFSQKNGGGLFFSARSQSKLRKGGFE